MVNPGHRSRGCPECRRAKVKCDEAQPACGRCVRLGRKCSGYAEADTKFRSMNESAKAKVQTRMRRRVESRAPVRAQSVPPHRQTAYLPGPTSSVASTTSTTSTPSRLELSTDWTQQAVGVFFADMVRGPDHLHSVWGQFEYLPGLYENGRAAYLTHSVHAAALAHLANVSSISELEQIGAKAYGRALHGLALAMSENMSSGSDEILATMNALATYEVSGTDYVHACASDSDGLDDLRANHDWPFPRP